MFGVLPQHHWHVGTRSGGIGDFVLSDGSDRAEVRLLCSITVGVVQEELVQAVSAATKAARSTDDHDHEIPIERRSLERLQADDERSARTNGRSKRGTKLRLGMPSRTREVMVAVVLLLLVLRM